MVALPLLLFFSLCFGRVFPIYTNLQYNLHFTHSFNNSLLSNFVTNTQPWSPLEDYDEQNLPIFLGPTPLEIVFNFSLDRWDKNNITVIYDLKRLGEKQLTNIYSELISSGEICTNCTVLIEGWPARLDTFWVITWAWVRYKLNSSSSWNFIEISDDPDSCIDFDPTCDPDPVFPSVYRTWIPEENFDIFADFLEFDNLYQKPVYGDCIFSIQKNNNSICNNSNQVLFAWQPLSIKSNIKQLISQKNMEFPVGCQIECRKVQQPAQFFQTPISFVVTVDANTVTWPSNIQWINITKTLPGNPEKITPKIKNWPEKLTEEFLENILQLDGEKNAVFPRSGKVVNFQRKSSADPTNQLLELFEYLSEYYSILGIQPFQRSFMWRNISQANLIAVIPGRNNSLPPLLLADHVDTAFCSDIYEKTGERVSNPGADDNLSATSTLMIAAKILRSMQPLYPIWLVHLTGEEYPAVDLGIRQLLTSWLSEKFEISGAIILDMMSWRNSSMEKIFQISAGESLDSLKMAKMAVDVSNEISSGEIVPAFRWRFDTKSFLFQTDGLMISDIGYPVILINELINNYDNVDRPYYHESTDKVGTLDPFYGIQILKVALETTAQLSQTL